MSLFHSDNRIPVYISMYILGIPYDDLDAELCAKWISGHSKRFRGVWCDSYRDRNTALSASDRAELDRLLKEYKRCH